MLLKNSVVCGFAFLVMGCATNEPDVISGEENESIHIEAQLPERHGYTLEFMPYKKSGVKVESSKNWLLGGGSDHVRLLEPQVVESTNDNESQVLTNNPNIDTQLIESAELEGKSNDTGDEFKKIEIKVSDFREKLSLLFAIGSSWIGSDSFGALKSLDPTKSYKVTGYADASGNGDFNLWLSQQRARNVALVLKEHSFNVVEVKGVGDVSANQPLHNPVERRVEIVALED